MTERTPTMVARVMAETGLGRNQVYRLARKRCIPATIIGRKFCMTEAQFERLQREGVKPEPQTKRKAS